MKKTIMFVSKSTNWWRCKVPGDALKRKGYNVVYSNQLIEPITRTGKIIENDIDTIYLYSVYDKPIDLNDPKNISYTIDGQPILPVFEKKTDIIKKYKELFGTRIIYGVDDNMFLMLQDHNIEGLEHIIDKSAQDEFITYLDIADVIVATRDEYKALFEQYEKVYNKNWSSKYVTIPNCVPDEMVCYRPYPPRSLNKYKNELVFNRFILPSQGKIGMDDTKQYKQDLIALKKYNDIMQIGANSTIIETNWGFNFNLSIEAYFEFLKWASVSGNFIGLIRLMSKQFYEFNIYKSNIKLIEAGYAGMGLLIDDQMSPVIYNIKQLKDVEDIYINDHHYYWIAPTTAIDVFNAYKIGNYIDTYEKICFK